MPHHPSHSLIRNLPATIILIYASIPLHQRTSNTTTQTSKPSCVNSLHSQRLPHASATTHNHSKPPFHIPCHLNYHQAIIFPNLSLPRLHQNTTKTATFSPLSSSSLSTEQPCNNARHACFSPLPSTPSSLFTNAPPSSSKNDPAIPPQPNGSLWRRFRCRWRFTLKTNLQQPSRDAMTPYAPPLSTPYLSTCIAVVASCCRRRQRTRGHPPVTACASQALPCLEGEALTASQGAHVRHQP